MDAAPGPFRVTALSDSGSQIEQLPVGEGAQKDDYEVIVN